jgi:hypothetical protein
MIKANVQYYHLLMLLLLLCQGLERFRNDAMHEQGNTVYSWDDFVEHVDLGEVTLI